MSMYRRVMTPNWITRTWSDLYRWDPVLKAWWCWPLLLALLVGCGGQDEPTSTPPDCTCSEGYTVCPLPYQGPHGAVLDCWCSPDGGC